MGIKHIVVVTDHPVYPVRDIQTEFKWTHPVFSGISQNLFPSNPLFCVNDFIYRIINPVKMTSGIRAVIWIAGNLLQKTQLLFRSDRHRIQIHSMFPQDPESFFCHGPGDGFGGQIKDLICHLFSHGLYRRKYGGKSLSDSSWRLDKQIFLPRNGLVD